MRCLARYLRRVRDVLGRLGVGLAWAALLLAALLWAASSKGRTAPGIVGAVLLVAVLLWTFAPWIPWVKGRLPAARRLAYLEGAWVYGRRITEQGVDLQVDLDQLRQRHGDWSALTVEWIGAHISVVEGERFRHPAAISPDRWNPTLGGQHARLLDEMHSQLDVLIRLRDEQRAQLR